MLLAFIKRLLQRPETRDPEPLMRALDSGKFDDEVAKQLDGVEATPLRKFAKLRPLDVAEWAKRTGIKAPRR